MAARAVALVAVVACLGCGKPTPSQTPVAAPVEPAAAEREPPPDLSPVAAPEDLIVVGRLSRPRVVVETLAGWSGFPLRVTDVLPAEARDLSGVVAWDAPVEFAAVLDRRSTEKLPRPLFVISVGVTSSDAAIEAARTHGVHVTPVAPGIVRLRSDDVSCAISVAVGSAPGRLVCGDDWRDVEELLPYATRGLPTANLGASDLHLELRAAPVQRRYAQELGAIRPLASILLRNVQSDSKRLDRALTDVVYALADEVRAVATEVRTLEVNARLDEQKKALDVGYALSLQGDASVTGQLFRESGRRATPAPEAFWQLPSAADTAMYQVATDSKRPAQWAAALGELADAYLEQQKVGAALRKRVRTALDSYVPAFWVASSTVSGGLDSGQPKSKLGALFRGGWSVSVMDARADHVTKSLSDLSALLAERELGALLKDRFHVDSKALPKVRRGTAKVRGFTARATVYTIELSEVFLDFVAQGMNEGKPPAAGGKKPEKETAVLIVAPDGERSWLSSAQDQKTAVQKLEEARGTEGQKLASVAELEPLRRERAVFAGYLTLAGLLDALAPTLLGERTEMQAPLAPAPSGGAAGAAPKPSAAPADASAREALARLLARMPNHGRSLWKLRMVVAEQGPVVTATSDFSIPQGAFQDAGSVGIDLAAKLGAAETPGSGRVADQNPK